MHQERARRDSRQDERAEEELRPVTPRAATEAADPAIVGIVAGRPGLLLGSNELQAGTIVGKALEPLVNGAGRIRVLVMLR